MFGSAESEKRRLIGREIIFQEYQPTERQCRSKVFTYLLVRFVHQCWLSLS